MGLNKMIPLAAMEGLIGTAVVAKGSMMAIDMVAGSMPHRKKKKKLKKAGYLMTDYDMQKDAEWAKRNGYLV